jgi:hypothetical protein
VSQRNIFAPLSNKIRQFLQEGVRLSLDRDALVGFFNQSAVLVILYCAVYMVERAERKAFLRRERLKEEAGMTEGKKDL